jgi:NAD(P)-dependent dehydrogenase (short-subunit alcohol dehydrogenase family)
MMTSLTIYFSVIRRDYWRACQEKCHAAKRLPFEVYGQAKLAMVLCTYALARRLTGTGVTANALHPGLTATSIVNAVALQSARPFLGIIKRFLQTPKQGARTALYLATSPEVEGVTGQYFVRGKPGRSVPFLTMRRCRSTSGTSARTYPR